MSLLSYKIYNSVAIIMFTKSLHILDLSHRLSAPKTRRVKSIVVILVMKKLHV